MDKLEAFADMIGKVPAEKIAEASGATVAEVEAWIASRSSAPATKPGEKPTAAEKKAAADAEKAQKKAAADAEKAAKDAEKAEKDAVNAAKAAVLRAEAEEKAARARLARRKVERIKVLETTGIIVTQEIRGKSPQKLRIVVPKSEYRGDIARKYASILKPSEFEVLDYQDES